MQQREGINQLAASQPHLLRSIVNDDKRETMAHDLGAHEAGEQSVLLVGTFLSNHLKHRTLSEELAVRLASSKWKVVTTSDELNRAKRLLDVVGTIWRERGKYNVAHVDVFSGAAFLWAEAACWMLERVGVPFVLTLRGGNLPNFARKNPKRVARLLKSAAVVTAPSDFLIKEMSAYRAELELLPNPLELADYNFRLREQPQPKLVWLRAFRNIYNPSLAPKVLAQLMEEFPEIKLTMFGHDKTDGSLELTQTTARELKVEHLLSTPGGVTKQQVPNAINSGDIFLNTTDIDNTPVSVIEAMACGLCVVSTNVGGIPYLLTHEENALLVPPDDAPAMAKAVRRLLTEPELAARLSRNARNLAEQFDWQIVMPQWKNLLLSTARQHAV